MNGVRDTCLISSPRRAKCLAMVKNDAIAIHANCMFRITIQVRKYTNLHAGFRPSWEGISTLVWEGCASLQSTG
jgi:hypothetical protein